MVDPKEMAQRKAVAEAGGAWAGTGAVKMSEKSTRDFKDGMESIETAGKMGAYSQLIELFDKLFQISTDPRIEQIMKFFELYTKFLRVAGMEDAGRIAEKLYAPENVQALKDLAEGMDRAKKGAAGSTEGIEKMAEAYDNATKAIEGFTTAAGAIPAALSSLGSDIVKAIKKGFIGAIGNIDWEDIIEDAIEEALS